MNAKRLLILACLLFVLLPPALAYGWTRYRYASGTVSGDVEWSLMGSTSGFLNREYNNVYRAEGCNSGWWRSEYRKSPGNFSDITSANETNCSPTSIGATTGPRQALCYKTSISIANTVTYNCDTTIP
jgi:hypothetical protein